MKGSRTKKQAIRARGRKTVRLALVSSLGLVLLLALIANALGTGVDMRVSSATDGAQANAKSIMTAMAAEGNYVAFQSDATNLVAEDTNGISDIFIKNIASGETKRVSSTSTWGQGDGYGFDYKPPSLTADGRYVAFRSSSTNLVPGETNATYNIFVKDIQTGVVERISTSRWITEASAAPSISSATGTYVAFASGAANFVAGDTNSATDVFVKNRSTGALTRVSTDSSGNEGAYRKSSNNPAISADGRYVAFESAATLAPEDTNPLTDIYLKDTATGQTTMISTDSNGVSSQANVNNGNAAISADGRYVTFYSPAGNLVADDTNGTTDVFVKDTQTGETTRISVAADGSEANSSSGGSGTSSDGLGPNISADGRLVTFGSRATNLVPGDNNGMIDIFVKDRLTGAIQRISTSGAGAEASNNSYTPSISGDGAKVAFASDAADLVTGDSNGVRDIFLASYTSAPPADTTAPVISNIQPSGTINSSSATVSAYFSDADPSSGIDTSTASLTVSGGTVSDCTVTATGITCTVTGLADGEHTINVTVADNSGNTGSGMGSFTVSTCQAAKPALGIAATSAFWASYADYEARLLSVNYSLSNSGPGTAYAVQIIGTVNTMGVGAVTEMPSLIGDIAVSGNAATVLKYNVPSGVGTFKSSIYASAGDVCGVSYAYPGPMPGA